MDISCCICGLKFKRKPSYVRKTKNPCCSLSCSSALRKITMQGESNHQYGVRGEDNSSFKSSIRINSFGYVTLSASDHPFKNCDGRILEHRLIAERFLLSDVNCVIVDGKRYLSPEYDVHHKDCNKLNNDPDNLLVLTRSEHKRLHHRLNRQSS